MKNKILVLVQSLLCALVGVLCIYRNFGGYSKIENKFLAFSGTLIIAIIFIAIERYIVANEKSSMKVLPCFPSVFLFLFLLSTPNFANDFNVIEGFTIPICNLLSNLYLSFSMILSLVNDAKKR